MKKNEQHNHSRKSLGLTADRREAWEPIGYYRTNYSIPAGSLTASHLHQCVFFLVILPVLFMDKVRVQNIHVSVRTSWNT